MNSMFLILFAPVMAWVWIRLAATRREPSTPMKFAWGLIFAGLGFAILVPPAQTDGQLASPLWLTSTYFLHTIGELFLSPVGLSAMTVLAPARIGGLMMGVWFLATSVGNFISGRVSGLYEAMPLPTLFVTIAAIAIVFGVILMVLTPAMRRLLPASPARP
jgi:POT family proton-dependent oligopeptide transporter